MLEVSAQLNQLKEIAGRTDGLRGYL